MTIREIRPEDVPAVVGLVHELAGYEREAESCRLTADQLAAALFAPQPALFGHVAELDGVIEETAALLPERIVARFIEQTKDANRRLIEMEERSFGLAREGRRQDALSLLQSELYGQEKRTYAAGAQLLLEAMK